MQGLLGISGRTRAASALPRALLFLILDPELSPLSRTFWRLRHTDVEYDIHSPTGSGLGTGGGRDGRGGDARSLPSTAWTSDPPWKVVFAPGMLPNILQYTGQPPRQRTSWFQVSREPRLRSPGAENEWDGNRCSNCLRWSRGAGVLEAGGITLVCEGDQ